MQDRLHWIDLLRGCSMIAILLFHTEVYMVGHEIINYGLYVTNALVMFFFISGYLMYKKTGIDIQHRLYSIIRTIIIPYFIFTTLIAIPKALAHHTDIDLPAIALNIFLGKASWFVAALAVAETLFAIIMWITRGKKIWILALSLVMFMVSIMISHNGTVYPWYINNGMQAVLFLCAGYLYHYRETFFNRFNTISYTSLLFILLIILKIYEYKYDVDLLICPIKISNYPVFLIDISISTLLLVTIFKKLRPCKAIEWTGTHSIVYYFFCGAIPSVISIFMNKVGLNYIGNYFSIAVAFILVYILTSAIAWIIYRYMPYITGRTARK